MVEFFKIINESNKNQVPINSKLLVVTIKAVDKRNSQVYNDWIEIYEILTGKKFDKKEEFRYL